MLLKKWEDLPSYMKCEEVRTYYDILSKRKIGLVLKRFFDVVVASIMLIILALPMVVIAAMIKFDSHGPVFYRQERVTTYGKHFRIHKFRTMVSNADKIGTAVTVGNDSRITRVGAKLRGLRLDELPQVLDVLSGNMSFVGTRPEAVKYVEKYKPEYFATLLLPAGITSEASIRYKDEAELEKYVMLLGVIDNVNKILQAVDIIVMPSLFEGLPFALLEAQAAGLKCVVSDTVSRESNILGWNEYLPLNGEDEMWASTILEKNADCKRENGYDLMKKSGFDIKDCISEFEMQLKERG